MRSIEEIYQAMLETISERSGFSPAEDCDLAVRLYAAAAQVQALELQADWVLDQSFPQTAQGVYLERHAAMRGLSRTNATRAVGTLRFSAQTAPMADLTIPAGSVCMTESEVRFQTTQTAILSKGGTSVDVPAEAVEAGASGNAAPGTIRILTACPVGITSCTNPAAFTGGSDDESDESLRARVLESYQRLPNGANAAYYQQVAMSHAGVAAAQVVGRARGIGTVDVYITTEAGVPSEELVEEVRADLQEKREIAVDVSVCVPTKKTVNVAVAVQSADNVEFQTVKAEVESALTNFFSGKLLGQPILLAELGNRIYQVNGVENYRFSAPTADVAGDSKVLPVLGTLTVTEMGA